MQIQERRRKWRYRSRLKGWVETGKIGGEDRSRGGMTWGRFIIPSVLPQLHSVPFVVVAAFVKQKPVAEGENPRAGGGWGGRSGVLVQLISATSCLAVHRRQVYLNGVSPGLRSLVISSKFSPFFATKLASLSATERTLGSEGGSGVEDAAGRFQVSSCWWKHAGETEGGSGSKVGKAV